MPETAFNLEVAISASILQLRKRSPFFGTLALFAEYRGTEVIDTAATNGHEVLFNPAFAASLSAEEFDAVLLHELLHAALRHCPRRGHREPLRWNIAADIVVNGIVRQQPGLKLPDGPVIDEKLEHLQVEEIYELVQVQKVIAPLGALGEDLLDPGERGDGAPGGAESHWKQAWHQAGTVQRMGQGKSPPGLERLLAQITQPRLDWKSMLWRFLVRTPVDFCEWDRRFLHRGLYLDALAGESLTAHICIDTSGSIDEVELGKFLSELQGILRSYPHLYAFLYYADAELHGPHELNVDQDPPAPKGGGGTSFVPFFEAVNKLNAAETQLCIYLTDGWGEFPKTSPHPTLWVVTPGGLAEEEFPFGQVARLVA